ncbi:hypothetical protein [Rhodococcus qingshengii]|uniref:hypothetical protein n=1 Tax=Rhodococcus qingshengii TaxID=334542 RepID=UPI001C8C201A|nr:hypothetical protein [Rhodococcus qingshengii]MBX9152008.1 hypothetical protein [Rhodococcus qingshengii]
MGGSIGPLVDADEYFTHQIVDTFASVSQTDHAWTEKVCLMAAAKDGSLQIGFGFGKYVNRNVVDGYAGVCRGREQWTVRGSRELSADPDSVDVGPIRYEVVEPLKSIRVVLERNDVQPIAFDLVLQGTVPCTVEEREDRRGITGYRRSADQIRYHQTGVVASGWVELEGERIEVSPQDWIMTRDHSWGVRPGVGNDIDDLAPDPTESASPRVLAVWNPLYFEYPDGTNYAFHQYFLHYDGPGFVHELSQGGFEFADGRRDLIRGIDPRLRFDLTNKRLLGGEFHLTMADGSDRILTAEAVSDTGFHLGAGGYLGRNGARNGSWRGPLILDGDYYPDTSAPESVEQLNQFRDCVIRVRDEETGALGWGNCQTWVSGDWPTLGLPEFA